MLPFREYLYHPFTDSSFGILLKNQSFPASITGFQVTDVDLYYQPLQDPVIAIVFFVLRLFIVIAGEFVHVKVFILMKKENGIAKDVTKLFTITQMIYWPFWLLFSTSTDFVHPLNVVVGQWYCFSGWFIFWYCWTTISFHSFLVALMRYFFIVHDKKVEAYGKDSAKKWFFLLSIIIPTVLTIWGILENAELDATSFINKCYGKHHKKFLLETSTLHTIKRNFCEFETFEGDGPFGKIFATLKRITCITKTIFFLVMGFNFTEAIVYYKIFRHINR